MAKHVALVVEIGADRTENDRRKDIENETIERSPLVRSRPLNSTGTRCCPRDARTQIPSWVEQVTLLKKCLSIRDALRNAGMLLFFSFPQPSVYLPFGAAFKLCLAFR